VYIYKNKEKDNFSFSLKTFPLFQRIWQTISFASL